MFRLKRAIMRCVSGTLEGKLKQKYTSINVIEKGAGTLHLKRTIDCHIIRIITE